MTNLSHNEFDNTDNTTNSRRAEEHDYDVVTVNDSGFAGKDELLTDDEPLVDDSIEKVDEDKAVPFEGELAESPEPAFDTPFVPAVESSADLEAEETADPNQPVPEALGEHRDGESIGEWLRNDWEQTKQDLHLGN